MYRIFQIFKSVVTELIIKTVCKFEKSYSNRYMYLKLFLVTVTVGPNTDVDKIMPKRRYNSLKQKRDNIYKASIDAQVPIIIFRYF